MAMIIGSYEAFGRALKTSPDRILCPSFLWPHFTINNSIIFAVAHIDLEYADLKPEPVHKDFPEWSRVVFGCQRSQLWSSEAL